MTATAAATAVSQELSPFGLALGVSRAGTKYPVRAIPHLDIGIVCHRCVGALVHPSSLPALLGHLLITDVECTLIDGLYVHFYSTDEYALYRPVLSYSKQKNKVFMSGILGLHWVIPVRFP